MEELLFSLLQSWWSQVAVLSALARCWLHFSGIAKCLLRQVHVLQWLVCSSVAVVTSFCYMDIVLCEYLIEAMGRIV